MLHFVKYVDADVMIANFTHAKIATNCSDSFQAASDSAQLLHFPRQEGGIQVGITNCMQCVNQAFVTL